MQREELSMQTGKGIEDVVCTVYVESVLSEGR